MGIGMNATPMRPESTGSVFSSSWKNADDSIVAFRLDDVSRQSEKMMIADSSTYFIMPKYISSSVFEWEVKTPTAASPHTYVSSGPQRHLGTANYVMFDGHGERLNYEDAIYAIVFK
jgi:prepilin-type processing-associated H-X9-DG protein